jgi:hypothetical protein
VAVEVGGSVRQELRALDQKAPTTPTSAHASGAGRASGAHSGAQTPVTRTPAWPECAKGHSHTREAVARTPEGRQWRERSLVHARGASGAKGHSHTRVARSTFAPSEWRDKYRVAGYIAPLGRQRATRGDQRARTTGCVGAVRGWRGWRRAAGGARSARTLAHGSGAHTPITLAHARGALHIRTREWRDKYRVARYIAPLGRQRATRGDQRARTSGCVGAVRGWRGWAGRRAVLGVVLRAVRVRNQTASVTG